MGNYPGIGLEAYYSSAAIGITGRIQVLRI